MYPALASLAATVGLIYPLQHTYCTAELKLVNIIVYTHRNLPTLRLTFLLHSYSILEDGNLSNASDSIKMVQFNSSEVP